ncbi:replicative DNA helicase [Blattabacterium cuenoti]|uniref:replicative DNA helicase n=1 Tax=Blattabacterium cuenoti TaxID=1653831 RepID=UPI00163CC679|nr:replicative DNA helicase [Blattabacterium cuenoti]
MKKNYNTYFKNNIEDDNIKIKLPPQSLEIEQAILGAIMIDKNGLDEVIEMLSPEVFYNQKHQIIYNVIYRLYQESNPIDLFTVTNELKKIDKLKWIGGEIYLIELTQKVISSAHIEYHSHIIIQKFLLRKLISISSEISNKCYEENIDILDLLDLAESKIFDLNQQFLMKKKIETIPNIITNVIDKIKSVKKNGISGISTGFHKLDDLTSGWQNSDLIVLASRPGMGKTTFMLSMVNDIVIEQQIPVMIFSIEMSSTQLITKLISSDTRIPLENLQKAILSKEDWDILMHKTNQLKKSPLFVDDTPSLSIFHFRAKCRRLVSRYGVKLIFIDYMQLMNANPHFSKLQNREQEISIISRSLKSIAKELDIPIIALSQLSRAVEVRGGNKRPLLSDLRESGSIEQDADIVLFIYRPEYYGFKTWDSYDENSSCMGESEIIIAKHRNGKLDKFRLKFISHQSRFDNIKEKKHVLSVWEKDYEENVINKEPSFYIPPHENDNPQEKLHELDPNYDDEKKNE